MDRAVIPEAGCSHSLHLWIYAVLAREDPHFPAKYSVVLYRLAKRYELVVFKSCRKRILVEHNDRCIAMAHLGKLWEFPFYLLFQLLGGHT